MDDIQKIIFQVGIDDTAYIQAVDSMSASTKILTQAQSQTNAELQRLEARLRSVNIELENNKKKLADNSNTSVAYQNQIREKITQSQDEQTALNDDIKKASQAYQDANKSAGQFAETIRRANQLQQESGGGKIITPGSVPVVAPIAQQLTQQITAVLNAPEFDLQNHIIEQTKSQFAQLGNSIALAEARMKQLNSTDDEFKLLAPIVAQGREALEKYNNVVRVSGESTERFRTQILLGRDALAGMELAGRQNTDAYTQLQKHVASLTQEYRIAEEQIRVLASQTRAFDFGKSAVQAAVSGFQVYTAVAILAGGQSEELQKKTLQLFAAMQLLASLEQLATAFKKGSIIATNLQSVSTAAYTAVVGASTGALEAFKVALASTGIGLAVIAIGFLVEKYIQLRQASNAAAEKQKLFSDINKEASKSASEQIAKLDLLKVKLNDTSIKEQDRLLAIKEYNTTADEKNTIDLKQIDNLTLINQKLDDQKDKLLQVAVATAATSEASKAAQPFIEASLKFKLGAENLGISEDNLKAFIKFNDQLRDFYDIGEAKGSKSISQREKDTQALERFSAQTGISQQKLAELSTVLEQVGKTKLNLDQVTSALSGIINIDDIFKFKKPGKDKSAIENVFEQERADLEAKLSELRGKEANTIEKINDQFAAKLAAEKLRIEKEIKEKKLTGNITDSTSQAGIIFNLAVQVNTQERDNALLEFNKKILDARQKLNDQLRSLQDKANLEQINLLQDEFDKRAKLIEFNEQKELADQKNATEERLRSLDTERLLIGEQEYQKDRQQIISIGEQDANNIILKFAQEREDLSVDIFQKTLERYQDVITQQNDKLDAQTALLIRTASDRFLGGNINFEQFQKQVNDIKEKADAASRNSTLQNNQAELFELDSKIATTRDHTTKSYKDLLDQRQKLSDDISKLDEEDAEADAKAKQDKIDKTISSINKYVSAIGDLASSVIGFWQAANAAEQKSLDRSIALQQSRVDAAQKIADRGNATYLKSETDRLKQLQVERENAARRQLGIDAALQASQILVGITGAISKIATPGIGAAETIAEIAVIIGALATGYGLVKTLQNNQPRLKTGTPYLTRGRHPQGDDTIPAWLTEGEAVIPQEKNRKYKKSVEAIYHGKVPAEVMNKFVENYVNNNIITNKSVTDKKEENTHGTYQTFVNNISKVPTKVLNEFITNYVEDKKRKKFFKGTPEVKGINAPAILTQSEEVIADHPAVRAIYNETIPAEHINEFVKNYHTDKVFKNNFDHTLTQFTTHNIKQIPQHNYQRIKEAAEVHNSQNSKMAFELSEQNKLIIENNELQRQTLEAMKRMKVSANIDKDGIAIAVNDHIDQIKKNKKL